MQKKYVPALVLFVVLLVVIAHLGARMTSVPAMTYASEEKKIYLTFDDGPSTVVTNRILDILLKEDVKATFFVVGARINGREETLRRIAREGHTIGVHSETHEYSKIYCSDESILADAETCADHIYSVTELYPRVYRFPGGGSSRVAVQTTLLRKRGFRVIGWNAVCGDEEIPHADANTLFQKSVETARGKNTVVLLCHDSATHAATADALPAIIAHFRDLGYVFCAY